MPDPDLRQGIEELRSAVEAVELHLTAGRTPYEHIRDLQNAVDRLRSSLWIILKRHNGNDERTLLSKMQVRRATESCSEILNDVESGTVTAGTAGVDALQATLQELAESLSARLR